jgi:hypothetical protein
MSKFDRGIAMKRYAAASALSVMIMLALANGAWAQGATNFPMIGITPAQSLQLNLVALPPQPNFPPVPCMAQMGFQNSLGSPVGTANTVTLQVGQSASLTLNGSTLASRGICLQRARQGEVWQKWRNIGQFRRCWCESQTVGGAPDENCFPMSRTDGMNVKSHRV